MFSPARTLDESPARGGSGAARMPLERVILLHLLPGIPVVLLYGMLAALLRRWGLPNLFALMLASLTVEVPLCWSILLMAGRRLGNGRVDWNGLLPWRARVPRWQYLVIGLPLIVFSMVMIGAVGPALGEALRPVLFGWVPAWFVMRPDAAMFATLSRPALMAMWVMSLVTLTLLGGITQEVYFRGFLLPRMERFGRAAAPLNAALFAIYHLTSPWSWPAFFLGSLPWAWVVRWKRSLWFGLFIHLGMLLLQWLMMTMVIFGMIEMPPAGG